MVLVDHMLCAWWSHEWCMMIQWWCLVIKCMMLVDQMHNFCLLVIVYQTSSSIIKHHLASWSIKKHHEASSSIIKHHQASSRIIKCHQALSSIIKLHQVSSSVMEPHQVSISIIKCHRTCYQASSWCFCFMMLYDALWCFMMLYGPYCNTNSWFNELFIDVLRFRSLTDQLTAYLQFFSRDSNLTTSVVSPSVS